MTVGALPILRLLAEQHSYRALVEACLATELDTPAAHVLLAIGYAYSGDPVSARRNIDTLDTDTLDIDARVDLAALHSALGDLDTAGAILEEAQREDDKHPLLLARLAWCRLHQDRADDAIALYEDSLNLQQRIAVYHNLLRLYLKTGALERAGRCLTAARAFWAAEQAAWPEEQRLYHQRELDLRQLELWSASESFAEADAWLENQREQLDEAHWCNLLIGYAQRLAERDRHAQAEEQLREGLKRCPENLALIRQLVELAEIQGRPGQAISLLRRAIRLATKQDKPTLPFRLTLAKAALQPQPQLARKAAEQALEEAEKLSPDDGLFTVAQISQLQAQAETALASVEANEQASAAAEDRYRKVLAAHPKFLPALQGLGQLSMQLGRIDDAIELFEQIKAIDPARGYAALINARRFPEDDETLEKLERVARQPGQEGSVRSSLLFQLASAWEKRKDHDKAFALADEANAASRKRLRYDAKAHRQRCARIRYAFNRALYDHRSDCGSDSELPVFVVGMPRSGTTLVEQILAGHSRIHGAGELGAIPRVIAGLDRWERQTGSGRQYPDCIDDLDAKVALGVAETVLSELREYAPEAARVVDKLPHNFENIGLIKFLFPKAKIISARRDPRDIAVSNFFTDYAAKHSGMGFAYDLDWIGEQLADHNLLMHHWQQVFPGEILEVRYEDLVSDPEASARRLLEYVGVEWEPQVLKFNELDRPVKTASVWQVRQPIYQTSKAKWRRYERRLAPLIAACNRRIEWEPIAMATLPEPGWLNQGVDHFRANRLDDAERLFKQLLNFLPEHAAATFMLGLVYARKGYIQDGFAKMEAARARCPWNRGWREDLAKAYELAGQPEKAAALRSSPGAAPPESALDEELPATTIADPPAATALR